MTKTPSQSHELDYYRLLQVQPDASVEVIRASYRVLMQRLKYHPDLGGDSQGAARLNAARDVLLDARKRAHYDASRNSNSAGTSNEKASPNVEAIRMRLISAGTAGPAAHRQSRRNTWPAPTRDALKTSWCSTDARACSRNRGQNTPVLRNDCAFCGWRLPVGSNRNHTHASSQCPRCGATLALPAWLKQNHRGCVYTGAHEQTGKRLELRYARDARADFFTEWPNLSRHTGRIMDLSRLGLCMSTPTPLAHGSIILICNDLLSSVACVVHCKALPQAQLHSLGVEFMTLSFAQPLQTFLYVSA